MTSNDPESAGGKNIVMAVRTIGTNALPTLLRMIGSSDGPLKSKLIKLVNEQKIVHAHILTADEKIFLAFKGFSILGCNAAPAVPELLKLTKHSEPGVRRFSLHSIFLILRHNDVVRSALAEALQDPDRNVGQWAAGVIRFEFPDDAERLGVYKMFPELKPPTTNSPPQATVK